MNLKSLSVLPSCAFQLIVICAFVSSRSITINESRQLSIESDDASGSQDLMAEESVIERRQGFGTQIGSVGNGIVGALRTGLQQLATPPLAVTRTFQMFPTSDGQFLQPTAAGFTINGQLVQPAAAPLTINGQSGLTDVSVNAVQPQQLPIQVLPIVIPQQQLASQIAAPGVAMAGGGGGFGGVGGGFGTRPFGPRIPPGRLVGVRGRNPGRIRALQAQRLQLQRLRMQVAQQRSPVMQPIIIQTPSSQQRTQIQPLVIQQAPNTPATVVLPVPIPQTQSEPEFAPVRQCGCGASLCSGGLRTAPEPQSCPQTIVTIVPTVKPEALTVSNPVPEKEREREREKGKGKRRDRLTEREKRRRKRRQKIVQIISDRLV